MCLKTHVGNAVMLRGQPGRLWETHVGNAVMLRGQPDMLWETHVGNAVMLRGQPGMLLNPRQFVVGVGIPFNGSP